MKLFLLASVAASASAASISAFRSLDAAAPTKMNFTSFTDDACATPDASKKPKDYKVGECKKAVIALCDATGTNATLVYYNDDACTSFNSSKSYVSGECTQTGPKTQRTSKIAVCF